MSCLCKGCNDHVQGSLVENGLLILKESFWKFTDGIHIETLLNSVKMLCKVV